MVNSKEILYACKEGDIEKVRLILSDTSINPSIYDTVEDIGIVNALHISSFLNHVKIMELLLEDGRIDPSVTGCLTTLGNLCSLNISSRLGHVEIVKLLLKDGRSDPNKIEGYPRQSPITWAFFYNNEEVIKVLISDPRVDINAPDDFSYDCLCYCCVYNNYELAEMILTNPKFDKAKCNYLSLYKSYSEACSNKSIDIIKLLIVFIDNYKFVKDCTYIEKYGDVVVNVMNTFKGSDEYNRMKHKYFKDQFASDIFYHIVMLSDNYLEIRD